MKSSPQETELAILYLFSGKNVSCTSDVQKPKIYFWCLLIRAWHNECKRKLLSNPCKNKIRGILKYK